MLSLGRLIRVIPLATAILGTAALAHAVGFKAVGTLAVDPAPRSVALADLNGDGKLDLVVASYDSNQTVSVFLGNGDGTFQPQVRYAGGSGPYGLAAANVNLDGIVDLLVANYNDDTISVLLGNGDGTFQPQAVFPTGDGPIGIVVADFNGDGLPDVATASLGAAVLLGNGDGSFQPPTFPTTEAANWLPSATSIATASLTWLSDMVWGPGPKYKFCWATATAALLPGRRISSM